MVHRISIKPRFIALALGSALAACSNDVVDLGGGSVFRGLEVGSTCAESSIVDGDVHVENQDELDALLGCEEIRGALTIDIFEDTDLTPLADLRAVDGYLLLGGFPTFPAEATAEAREAYQLDYDRVNAIAAANWLPSLEGVESLERVGSLFLLHVSAPSLDAFASLRLVTGGLDSELAGQLAISSAPNLVDLGGLENARGIRTIELRDTPALESLNGLHVGTTLLQLRLENSPALENIDALAPVTMVSFDVYINGTAIPNVDALANLSWATMGLALANNPELTNVDALVGLTGAQYLVFEGNAKLERLPEFSNIQSFEGFKVVQSYTQAWNDADRSRPAATSTSC
jgi:hypothetical protein